ncbi:MAG: AMP-dependent synthetase/ligase [Bacteroidota bacterium]
MEVKRLFDIPYYQLEKFPKEDSLAAKVDGKWIKHSTQEFIDNANLVSMGLLKLGIKPGDKIAMVSNNRPEWNMMDIGILQIGAVDVPVYSTITEDDYKFIFNHAEVKLCFVSDEELLQKVRNIKDEIPTLEEIYTFDKIEGAKHWTEITGLGKDGDISQVENLKAQIKENDLATLIYTSGTTGNPKGVMLSHNNIVSNCHACTERMPVDHNAIALSFLPICHSFERMIVYLYMLSGVSIYYAESMETIGDNLREVKPQIFSAVPRLLEKVFDKIVGKGKDLTGIKKSLFYWALNLGLKYELHGANGWWYEFKLKIARKLIFSKWQEALGGNTEAVASGSAALQPRLARVFNAACIPVMEGYGLTETSPVVSVNCEMDKGIMFGTVGRPISGVEVKIAGDGEILTKGPNIMIGYYKRDDLTREVIDEDGWLHTGDIGEMVNGEFLKITDRKKEIFKTSGGKYIAPQQMENKYKESTFIEQIMVIGENRKHPAALVSPAFELLKEWCNNEGISYTDNKDMIQNQKVQDKILEEIKFYNKNFGQWEHIKKIEIIPEEWSINTGELTPTLKLKRKVIMSKYQHLVDKIYKE